MGQDTARELEDLEQLIAEPGWARFTAFVAREWGAEAYRRHVQQALAHIPATASAEREARDTVLQIEAAARAVERVVSWPQERVRALRAKTETATTTWPHGGVA